METNDWKHGNLQVSYVKGTPKYSHCNKSPQHIFVRSLEGIHHYYRIEKYLNIIISKIHNQYIQLQRQWYEKR